MKMYASFRLQGSSTSMPRTVRDSKLETRTARAHLKASGKPYYRAIDPGLHLGYRKNKNGGRWVVRLYVGNQEYRVRSLQGTADDKQDANGVSVLSYSQAQAKARQLFADSKESPINERSGLTVRQACEDYVVYLRAERKTGDQTLASLEKHILPRLGNRLIVELKTKDIDKIKHAMVRTDENAPDVERASKDTANRVMSMLRAALNRAFCDEDNKILSDAAWRRVKQFRNVSRARQAHLDVKQSNDLIAKCSGAFRKLVTAALLTGARTPHELAQRLVRDFQPLLGTLSVFDGKTGSREIVLTEEAIEYFKGLTEGRDADDLLLPKDDGTPWLKNHHQKPMRKAVKEAKLDEKCTIYALRHTYASQSILAGMNIKLLAENMGTSIRMLEKHYGKFIAASRRKLVEESAFKLGLVRSRST